MEDKKIKVEREIFEKGEKSYSSYYIKGEVRGKQVKVQVIPPDFGGYKVLDIVYNGDNEAELQLTPYKFTTDDGQVLEGNTFKIVSFDEDGTIYECPVKPARSSDKSLLKMLLR
jgi:hypothetical protein